MKITERVIWKWKEVLYNTTVTKGNRTVSNS